QTALQRGQIWLIKLGKPVSQTVEASLAQTPDQRFAFCCWTSQDDTAVSGMLSPFDEFSLHQPLYQMTSRWLADTQDLSKLVDGERVLKAEHDERFQLSACQVEL